MNNDIEFLNIEWRTRYFFTNYEDRFWIACPSYFYTPICVVSGTFVCRFDPKLQWLIGRTNLYYSTGVDLYSHKGAVSIRKTVLPGMAIPMLKIRRPNGRLIFNMEIAIRR